MILLAEAEKYLEQDLFTPYNGVKKKVFFYTRSSDLVLYNNNKVKFTKNSKKIQYIDDIILVKNILNNEPRSAEYSSLSLSLDAIQIQR